MRIVIKPVGLALICGALVGLSIVAFRRGMSGGGGAGDTPPAPAAAPAAKGGGGAPAKPVSLAKAIGPNLLRSGDFEGSFVPILLHPIPKTARIDGDTVNPWYDNSGWANLGVNYARETGNPHGGKTCQKFTVHDISPGGQVQFVQTVNLKVGKTYQASFWARAESPATIEIALRQVAPPQRCFSKQIVTVGPSWQQLAITGKIVDDGTDQFMVIVMQPNSTVWVDDAVLTEVS